MSERIRRYIPSFKQRKPDGRRRRSRATFLGGARDDGTPTANERDMETALARVRQLENQRDKGPVAARRSKRRQVIVKRQEPEGDPNPVPEIVEGVEGAPPGGTTGGTVTISIGLTLQVTTVSAGDSTFVSVSTSWFTFDATGGISSASSTWPPPLPTWPTPPVIPTANPALDTTSTIETSSASLSITTLMETTTSESPLPSALTTTFVTVPPTSISISSALDQTTSLELAPDFLSTVPVVPAASSIVQTISANATRYGMRTRTSSSRSSTSLRDTTTTSRRATASLTSTRVTTSIDSASTIYADSAPTSPVDSPVTPAVEGGPDAGSGGNNGQAPLSERLPPILGGVFGGLAGVGLLLWAILFFLRRHRGSIRPAVGILGGGAGGRNGHRRAFSQETGGGSVGEMSQARGSLMPGFLAPGGIFGGRSSVDTAAEPAERGFVKISGRKLPSMYGDDMVPVSQAVASARASASEPGSRNVSGGTQHVGGAPGSARGSMHQDDEIMHAPTPSPFPPSMARTAMRSGSPALVSSIAEDEPEPVKTRRPPPPPPHIHEPEGSSRYPTPPPGAVRRMHSLVGPDGVGRSLASQDGSKTSRFTEDV